jgi:2-C-methyl-D-erythritol 4-phosphate cytidylyltransferase
MSQQELADAMGYRSRSTISKIEAGYSDIPHSKLRDFATVLDTTLDYLVYGDSVVTMHYEKKTPENEYQKPPRENKNIAVILAGGKSTRNLQNVPNQFVNVYGKPVIIYCMEAYQRHPAIDEIYVVCLKGWEDILQAYTQQFNITKLREILVGGNTGIESVKNAIQYLAKTHSENDSVFLQEATRPMINEETISNAWTCYKQRGSAVAYLPMTDYIQFFVEPDGKADYIDRNRLYSVQSPETYSLHTLLEAFAEAESRGFPFNQTCCTMLMHALGKQHCFYTCGVTNIKIVRQEDLAIFRALLKQE